MYGIEKVKHILSLQSPFAVIKKYRYKRGDCPRFEKEGHCTADTGQHSVKMQHIHYRNGKNAIVLIICLKPPGCHTSRRKDQPHQCDFNGMRIIVPHPDLVHPTDRQKRYKKGQEDTLIFEVEMISGCQKIKRMLRQHRQCKQTQKVFLKVMRMEKTLHEKETVYGECQPAESSSRLVNRIDAHNTVIIKSKDILLIFPYQYMEAVVNKHTYTGKDLYRASA